MAWWLWLALIAEQVLVHSLACLAVAEIAIWVYGAIARRRYEQRLQAEHNHWIRRFNQRGPA